MCGLWRKMLSPPTSPSPSPQPSSLVTFCGRATVVPPRSRALPPFLPKKEVFLRLRGDVISLHKDEDSADLLTCPLSLSTIQVVKAKGRKFKLYSADSVLRVQLEEALTPAFSFLLEESWERNVGVAGSVSSAIGWTLLGRGWTKWDEEREWMDTVITLTQSSIVLSEVRGGKRRVVDVRAILKCEPQFESSQWCSLSKKKKEKGQVAFNVRLLLDGHRCVVIDSHEESVLSSLLALVSSSLSHPQSSLSSCRLATNGVPLAIHRCLDYLSKNERLSIHGIYRVSAKSKEKERLLDIMIHSPCTFLSSPTINLDLSPEKKENGECRDEVYAVCDCLRAFLRSMDEPLIPQVLHIPLFDAISDDSSSRPQKVCSVLRSRHLPSVHSSTLFALLSHLREVASRSEENGMTSENLSKVFAPAFFSSRTSEDYFEEVGPRVLSVHYLIEHFDSLRL